MGFKKCLLIPATILPYMALGAVYIIFGGSPIMEIVFGNNAFALIGILFGFILLAVILTGIAFAVCLAESWDPVWMAKAVMIIKLVQIPAYLVLFVLGVLFWITLWTIPFSFAFALIDGITIFMSGLLGTASVILALREKKWEKSRAVWPIVLQFIYCADIVASILFYKKLKAYSAGVS